MEIDGESPLFQKKKNSLRRIVLQCYCFSYSYAYMLLSYIIVKTVVLEPS